MGVFRKRVTILLSERWEFFFPVDTPVKIRVALEDDGLLQ